MKKMIILFLTIIILLFPSLIYSGGLPECWNVTSIRQIAPGVVHHFVDRTCDMIPDIVQEYRWVNGTWIPTQWWWL